MGNAFKKNKNKENKIIIPPNIRILVDIDLAGEITYINFYPIFNVTRMTKENYITLITRHYETFEKATSNYICNICKKRSNIKNFIYTNKQYNDYDLCTNCICLTLQKKVPYYVKDQIELRLRDIVDAVK